MPCTRISLSEQAQTWLGGGQNPDAQNVHILDLMTTINQIANKFLKMQALETYSMGEEIPSGAAIGEYNNIPVVKYNNVSSSKLPVYPVKLRKNLGLFEIFPSGDPSASFIILQQGDLALLKTQPLLNQLSGRIGAIPNGMIIQYTKDLTVGGTLTPTVTMRLVVLDFSKYSDTDILPIAADQEYDLLTEVVRFYGGEPAPDKIVDPGTKDTRTAGQLMA